MAEKLACLTMYELPLRPAAILERGHVYLIPLLEELALPDHVYAKANPKSSTGRLDVFTRVITDASQRFDDIRPGYSGRLYLEIFPRSFTIKVAQGLSLNQLRAVQRPRAAGRRRPVSTVPDGAPALRRR